MSEERIFFISFGGVPVKAKELQDGFLLPFQAFVETHGLGRLVIDEASKLVAGEVASGYLLTYACEAEHKLTSSPSHAVCLVFTFYGNGSGRTEIFSCQRVRHHTDPVYPPNRQGSWREIVASIFAFFQNEARKKAEEAEMARRIMALEKARMGA